jgi:hypothetical protein
MLVRESGNIASLDGDELQLDTPAAESPVLLGSRAYC